MREDFWSGCTISFSFDLTKIKGWKLLTILQYFPIFLVYQKLMRISVWERADWSPGFGVRLW